MFALSSCTSAPSLPTSDDSASVSQTESTPDTSKSFPEVSENTVAPGFEFEISHPEDKMLKGKFRVEFDGIIRLPYRVSINAGGLDFKNFTQQVISAYRPYFRTGTPVSIQLTQRRYWIDVRGVVNKPGKYLIKFDASIDEVIAQCNGLIPDKTESEPKFVRIQQKTGTSVIDLNAYYQSGNMKQFPPWQGGDIVFFQHGTDNGDEGLPSSTTITILGAVNHPGEVYYGPKRDFFAYLSLAGGQAPHADMGKIEIVRKVNGQPTSIKFDSQLVSQIPAFKSGDVLIVGKDAPTFIEKTLQLLTNVATILSAVAIMVVAHIL